MCMSVNCTKFFQFVQKIDTALKIINYSNITLFLSLFSCFEEVKSV